MSMDLDQSKPFTDEQKQWCHEWSLDYLVEENERRHAQRKVHDRGEPVDLRSALEKAGVEQPEAPPNPTYVGAMGGVQQGPLIVEGEDNSGRVPLPRDHSLTYPIDEPVSDVSVDVQEKDDGKFDTRATRAEVNKLNVDELKDNLRELDEPVSGSKDELRDRLVKALKKDFEEQQKGE